MADGFRVVCDSCGKGYRISRLIPGQVPACRACGGTLGLTESVRLTCPACSIRTRPAKIRLDTAKPCPRCKAPLQVLPVEPVPASVAPEPERTIAAQPPVSVAPTTASGADSDPPPASVAPASEEATVLLGKQHSRIGSVFPGRSVMGAKEGDSSADASGGEPDLELRLEGEDGKPRRQTFGKYRLIEEIARGGMGIVYRAEDPDLRRVVALKVLIAGEDASEESIKRFLREARSAGRMRHANIVPIHEVGTFEGQHYFTMDFVDGRDFGEAFQDPEMSLRDLLEALYEVCRALREAHAKGIIHRDLKPQNILIDRSGRALLTDFGLAKDLTSQSIHSLTGTVFGTPAYMSPEQAQGRTHEIDHRTDIYSLGVLLYEVATGEKPFGGETLYDTIEAVIHRDPTPPRAVRPDVDPDLNTIIMRCLEKDPERRYQDMRELSRDLGNYIDGQPIKARPVGLARTLARRAASHPRAVAGAAAGAVVLLLALFAYAFLLGDSIDEMRTALESGDPTRMAAATALLARRMESSEILNEDDRARALEVLRMAVGGESPEAEAAALDVLVSEPDPLAGPVLAEAAVRKELPETRRVALLRALDQLGRAEADFHDVDSLSALVVPLLSAEEESTAIRSVAATALGGLWSGDSSKALQAVARDTGAPQGVRLESIHALGRHVLLGSQEMKTLLALHGAEDDAIAAAAANAVSSARGRGSIFAVYGIQGTAGSVFSGAAAVEQMNAQHQQNLQDLIDDAFGGSSRKDPAEKPVETIARALKDSDVDRRLAAARDLGVLGDADALPHLEGALLDPKTEVRRAAGRAVLAVLAKSPSQSVEWKPIARQLEDNDALVRADAAWMLGRLETADAVPDLVRAMGAESSPRARRAMLHALAAIGDTGGLASIRKVLDESLHTNPDLAAECLQAMQRFGRAAAPHLIHGLGSTSRRVRNEALKALREVSGRDFGPEPQRWQTWLESAD